MKLHASLVCIATLLSTIPTQAQTDTEVTRKGIRTYRFDAAVPVRECTFGGKDLQTETTITAPYGAKFSYLGDVVSGDSARVVLQFLEWATDPYKYRRFNVKLTSAAEQRLLNAAALRTRAAGLQTSEANASRAQASREEQTSDIDVERTRTFCVNKAIFDRTATEVFDRFSWDLAAGILLLPIKLRGGGSRDFDFSKDVTLGTVAGPRWRIHEERDVFVSMLVGAGITAVTLDAENTNGVLTEATDRAAVTITGGFMVDVNRFQLGLMLGWDHISNPNQLDWEYQGHRWLSIGLGYTLLSTPPSAPAGGKQ